MKHDVCMRYSTGKTECNKIDVEVKIQGGGMGYKQRI